MLAGVIFESPVSFTHVWFHADERSDWTRAQDLALHAEVARIPLTRMHACHCPRCGQSRGVVQSSDHSPDDLSAYVGARAGIVSGWELVDLVRISAGVT